MSAEFDAQDRAEIDAICARYPHRAAALLPVLHYAQDKFGCLDLRVQRVVAQTLDVPPPRVHEVVTFYEMFHEHAEGQFHLEVCTNISCHLTGGDQILDHLRSTLGIECGHRTADGTFSLMEAECLASCGSGPMMKVGLDYYEYLTTDAVDALLEHFRVRSESLNGKAYQHQDGEPHVGPVKGFEPPRPVAGLGSGATVSGAPSDKSSPRPSAGPKSK